MPKNRHAGSIWVQGFASALLLGTAMPVAADEFGLQDTHLGGYVFSPYGRFNHAYQSWDDGAERIAHIVDVNTSSARLGFFLRPAEATTGISFQFESSLGFRPSQNTSQLNTPAYLKWTRRNLRQVQIIHTSGFGVIRAGQGSQATDAIAEIDLGRNTIYAKSNISEMLGDYLLRARDGDLVYEIGSTFATFDGSRRFRLRYDTPDFGGFSLAASYGREILREGDDNRYYDYALRYETEFGDLQVAAGIGQNFTDSDTQLKRATMGSASVFHSPSGLSLTVAAGQSHAAPDPSYVWVKGGWAAEFFAIGATKFVLEAFAGDNYETRDSRSDMWGMAVAQRVERYALELFAAYRVFSFEERKRDFHDAETFLIGAEIRF